MTQLLHRLPSIYCVRQRSRELFDQHGDRQISLRAREKHLIGGDAFDAVTGSDRMWILILAPFLDGLLILVKVGVLKHRGSIHSVGKFFVKQPFTFSLWFIFSFS